MCLGHYLGTNGVSGCALARLSQLCNIPIHICVKPHQNMCPSHYISLFNFRGNPCVFYNFQTVLANDSIILMCNLCRLPCIHTMGQHPLVGIAQLICPHRTALRQSIIASLKPLSECLSAFYNTWKIYIARKENMPYIIEETRILGYKSCITQIQHIIIIKTDCW